MMRLRTYAGLSFVSTLAVIYHAFNSRGQFYPAMVYLSTSKVSLVLLLNMGLVVMCVLWQLTKLVFLGSLREAEVERLNEQSWREVMEILFAITIFRQEFSVSFLAMVTALLLIKALHWLAQKRELYETFRNFKIRVADYLRYRKITSNMNDRFPDATPEELAAEATYCPTCRALVVPSENGTSSSGGQHGAGQMLVNKGPAQVLPHKGFCSIRRFHEGGKHIHWTTTVCHSQWTGKLNLSAIPTLCFCSYPVPGANGNSGEGSGSNQNISDSKLEAQKKIIQQQIEHQLQILQMQKPKTEESSGVGLTASSDCKGKAVASSSEEE
ncbi:FAR1-related sequence 11 [Hibiscus syriacus]|uniref:FAR1-related sequence 11 n=1 Tax=Hibiscus syriacus TaxID=106335 RepID=A0A6A3D4U9_HIBSY|nr:FAR1-related sequence 11 [Hibiscus syriacus]